MEKHFEASTRREAIDNADQWWAAQTGLMQTFRFTFAIGEDPSLSAMSGWKVIIHYQKSDSN